MSYETYDPKALNFRSDYVRFGKHDTYVAPVYNRRQEKHNSSNNKKEEKEKKRNYNNDEDYTDRSFCLDGSLNSLALINMARIKRFGEKVKEIDNFIDNKLNEKGSCANPFTRVK